jgi:hypothetical protein
MHALAEFRGPRVVASFLRFVHHPARIEGCAVLEVVEECPYRHSRICENPHTADL